MQNLSGMNLKGYELLERIGAGGFGAVYRARQTSIDREVAVKIILPGLANEPDFIRRFETEARLIARLEHPHITPLHDFWRDLEGAYLVMRYLRGGSLRDAINKEGAYDLNSTSRLLDQLASALDLAHRNDVIHRDIKPGNILLDEDGNAYLADFGIAKDLVNVKNGHTSPDSVVGSLDYISPEQARSEAVTPRTDIYSLGVTLYEMITGEHPFKDSSAIERLYKHLSEPLPLIATLPEDRREAINEIIQRATAKNPSQRYADVFALAVAFREAVGRGDGSNELKIIEQLTWREQEVLQLIAQGRSNKEIAEQLVVTVAAVRWHIRQAYKKLGVRSRVQAIVRARELELIVSGDTDYQRVKAPVTIISLPEPENPYKGLHAFEAADSRDFFGREEFIEKLIRRMGESERFNRFLAVIGPSGSGKSSLVKAGLIPALWKGAMHGSERWFVIEMIPGSRPLDQLEVALMRIAAHQVSGLHEQLARDENGLLRIADLILPKDRSELVLVVDQFEEVFTLVEEERERLQFLKLLHAAATDRRSRVRVIVTLRADYYDRPLYYPEFGELIRSRMETVLPLSAKGMERAIAGPAERVGVVFEPGLVAQIVSEMNYQAGALPLLQYALTELFERRQGRMMSHEAYRDIGGAVGALAYRADEIYANMDKAGQELVRQMFLRLVTLGEGAEDARRRTPCSELLQLTSNVDVMDEIIDTFADYRLLSLDNDPGTRQPTVEVAHEAILREWERLRQWLNASREDIRQERALAQSAGEWEKTKRDKSYLLHGTRLEQFERWYGQTEIALTALESEFITESITEREHQQAAERERQVRETALERRSVQQLRALVAVFAAAALVAAVLSIFAVSQQQVAQQEERIAIARELAAASVNNLDIDPERSVLLAMHSLTISHTVEAEIALHRAYPRLHLLDSVHAHDGIATAVTYSPDGRLVASSGWGGTKVWDAVSHELLLTLNGHACCTVNDAVFSPDSSHLATAGPDGLVIVWNVATGEQVMALDGHDSTTVGFQTGVLGVAYSPDGRYIASGGTDGIMRLWDAATGETVQIFQGHEQGVSGLAFSPDGTKLASGSWDWTAKIWSVPTGDEILTLTHPTMVLGVAFSPDGTRLATTLATDGLAQVWDAETGQLLLNLWGHQGIVEDVAFSPDGYRLATSGWDGAVRLWNILNGQQLLVLDGHNGIVQDIAFRPDGRELASVGGDTSLRFWDIAPDHELLTIPVGSGWATAVAYSPDGLRLVAGDRIGPSVDGIRIWDANTGLEVLRLETPDSLAISMDVTNIRFSPDGSHIAATVESNLVNGQAEAYLWDAATGAHLQTFSGHTNWLYGLAFSPDGLRLATAGHDATVRVWDIETGEELLLLMGHQFWVWSVAFSPDGERLVTASRDTTAMVWDANTGEPLLTWPDPDGVGLYDADFSPDGTRVLVARENGSAMIWDSVTGEILLIMAGHTGAIIRTSYSVDGSQIATAAFDNTAKVWDAETGRELLTLFGPMNSLLDATFSPDGSRLATGSFDVGVRVYTLQLDELWQLSYQRLTRSLSDYECQTFLHMNTCPELPGTYGGVSR